MSCRSSVLAALGGALWVPTVAAQEPAAVAPLVTSVLVTVDSDDPALWINPDDPAQSLVIGTDKGEQGALYVFGLDGKIRQVVSGLARPNNVDVEYGLQLGSATVDIAVTTERLENRLRVFRLPDMEPIDGGGIPVFEGEEERAPMGVALYRRPSDGAVFAIVSRKEGPQEGYLGQYRLRDDGSGQLVGSKLRAFGRYSGEGEIEAIAVDDALGHVYYSDELTGIRKYPADPDARDAGQELALFGQQDFTRDREGISIYALDQARGYILVSDQQANLFRVYPREGTAGDPHRHELLATLRLSTVASDGSEASSTALGEAFPAGIFMAMSEERCFQFYSWAEFSGQGLEQVPAPGE